MKFSYKGWNLYTFEQEKHPKFKAYVTICRKELKDRIVIYNIEGASLKQAENIAKDMIDAGEITILPKSPELIKPEFQ